EFCTFIQLLLIFLEIVIYLLCFAIGGPLNVICFGRSFRMYEKNRKYQNHILLLRLHLNIADLLTIFIYTPTQIIWMATFQWYGGDVLCRICKFFHTFNFYLNSFVIAVMAIDRAQGTYRINDIKASKLAFRCVKYMLAFSYIAATIFSMPQVFIFRVFQPNESVEFRQVLQVLRLEKMYNITHLLLIFWIPTAIITFSYIFVIYKLNSMKRKNRQNCTEIPFPIGYIAKRQAAMILIAYLALWSPYNILAMMNTLAIPSENHAVLMDTLHFLNALIVVNPVVNPLIYGLFQRN
ncbi:unnamed protein product, partial [Thelazia callipaeda]|uniref:G_PROTEIN_RECEP_F1_2 domain-containing protein n=1 Tax=Thelazia callipaeda TaxID=103827 RepID=A0A0N5CYT7_THECL